MPSASKWAALSALLWPCLATELSAVPDSACMLQKRMEDVGQEEQEHMSDGLALSNSIMELAESLEEGETKEFLRSFRICGSCKAFKRFGEDHDGGYLSCVDHMARGDIKAAYSMGVEGHDRWSEDVHEGFGVPVFQYDCTVEKAAQDCDNCKFFQACLKGNNGKGGFAGKASWTLKEAVMKSGQKEEELPPRSLLMKMDIEGSEWPTLGTSSTQTLTKFRQILMEFHDLGDESRHKEMLNTMRNLQASGFKVVHLHGNDFSRPYKKNGYSIPSALEVSLDAMVDAMDSCLVDETRDPLDQTNKRKVRDGHDLPLAHLPE